MRIDLVFPVLPPVLDGIGDYTAHLAQALAQGGHQVRVLTAQDNVDAWANVAVERAFSIDPRHGVHDLLDEVASDPPDWLLLQFNQFSYGRWGFNPHLPLAIYRLRRRWPQVNVAVMFHEDFVPVTSWKNAVMTTWQRAQFWALGRQANVIGFSIQPWAEQYRSWFPHADVVHWPVGSNMPRVDMSRTEARSRLGIASDTFVAGVFGTLNASRPADWIRDAARALHARVDSFLLLYVGPNGDTLKRTLHDVPLRDAGALPADEVSIHLSAMDMHLTPFIDGASTRRGSFLAGLQHGVPTVSTLGPLTDPMLREHDGTAFMLTPADHPSLFAQRAAKLAGVPEAMNALGSAARRYFDAHFTWRTVAQRVEKSLAGERTQPPVSASRQQHHQEPQ